jgi:hypothetical protein
MSSANHNQAFLLEASLVKQAEMKGSAVILPLASKQAMTRK